VFRQQVDRGGCAMVNLNYDLDRTEEDLGDW
jgi:hypothetical protein